MARIPVALFLFAALIANSTGELLAQRAVEPSARYYHLICLVHLTGSGGAKDPVRAEHVPASVDAGRAGIIAWKTLLTDRKDMAIVHLVGVNRKAFEAVLSDKRQDVLVFEPGKDSKEKIETELRKYRKDFDLNDLEVQAQ